jgi:hypothetical protein
MRRYAPTDTAFRGCSAPSRILLQGREMEQGLPAPVAREFALGAARFARRRQPKGACPYVIFGSLGCCWLRIARNLITVGLKCRLPLPV